MPSTVLVTGGAGYIGSHTCVELLAAGHRVLVVDDLSNSSRIALDRVRELSPGPLDFQQLDFHEVDICDAVALDAVMASEPIDGVIHFAGRKAVGESVAEPLLYYRNNMAGTVNLLESMQRHGVRRLVFSSSCTVYGNPGSTGITEDAPLGAINPYGRSKLFIEEMMRDLAASAPASSGDGWHIALLRYFNPVGAHPSGRIGEDPKDIPNNLMPYVMQVAVGRLDKVRIFGGDYDTVDGTGVRDYIHVMDLANGHLAALDAIDSFDGCRPINLGTGRGSSVLEVVQAASRAVGRDLPYEIVDRRPGDAASVVAEPALAQELLGWKATRTIDDMCADHWNWQRSNPEGYR